MKSNIKIDSNDKYFLISFESDQFFSIIKQRDHLRTERARKLEINEFKATIEILFEQKWYKANILSSSNDYSTIKRRAKRLQVLPPYRDFVQTDLDIDLKKETITVNKNVTNRNSPFENEIKEIAKRNELLSKAGFNSPMNQSSNSASEKNINNNLLSAKKSKISLNDVDLSSKPKYSLINMNQTPTSNNVQSRKDLENSKKRQRHFSDSISSDDAFSKKQKTNSIFLLSSSESSSTKESEALRLPRSASRSNSKINNTCIHYKDEFYECDHLESNNCTATSATPLNKEPIYEDKLDLILKKLEFCEVKIKILLENISNLNPEPERIDKVMFGNINLLNYSANDIKKYVSILMEVLFTQKERHEGYIIEGKSASSKKPLDLGRVKLLKEAVFAKYNILPSNQAQVWADLAVKAKQKCINTPAPTVQQIQDEERRRQKEQQQAF